MEQENLEMDVAFQEEENALEAYLAPSANIGAYTEQDLTSSFNSLQSKLRSLGIPVCGDLFRNDLENVKASIRTYKRRFNSGFQN